MAWPFLCLFLFFDALCCLVWFFSCSKFILIPFEFLGLCCLNGINDYLTDPCSVQNRVRICSQSGWKITLRQNAGLTFWTEHGSVRFYLPDKMIWSLKIQRGSVYLLFKWKIGEGINISILASPYSLIQQVFWVWIGFSWNTYEPLNLYSAMSVFNLNQSSGSKIKSIFLTALKSEVCLVYWVRIWLVLLSLCFLIILYWFYLNFYVF